MSREEQSTVVNMLLTLFLAMLLMIAGIGRAAVSDLQATGKFNDRTLGCKEGRHKMRKELHHQVSYFNKILRFGMPRATFLFLKVRICCSLS